MLDNWKMGLKLYKGIIPTTRPPSQPPPSSSSSSTYISHGTATTHPPTGTEREKRRDYLLEEWKRITTNKAPTISDVVVMRNHLSYSKGDKQKTQHHLHMQSRRCASSHNNNSDAQEESVYKHLNKGKATWKDTGDLPRNYYSCRTPLVFHYPCLISVRRLQHHGSRPPPAHSHPFAGDDGKKWSLAI